MDFTIQASNPMFEQGSEREVEELATAIQMTFPMNTEAAIMVWNSTPIRLSYKYDLGVVVYDLLAMLEDLLSPGPGATSVSWSSTTFMADWDLQWMDGRLDINTNWASVEGHYEDLLNRRAHLETDQQQFASEWKRPLRTILTGIDQSKMRVADTDGCLARLRRIEAALPTYGRLYSSLT